MYFRVELVYQFENVYFLCEYRTSVSIIPSLWDYAITIGVYWEAEDNGWLEKTRLFRWGHKTRFNTISYISTHIYIGREIKIENGCANHMMQDRKILLFFAKKYFLLNI